MRAGRPCSPTATSSAILLISGSTGISSQNFPLGKEDSMNGLLLWSRTASSDLSATKYFPSTSSRRSSPRSKQPSTAINDDDVPFIVVRPIDALCPRAFISSPIIDPELDQEWRPSTTSSSEKLLLYWQSTQKCLNLFWDLWRTYYLPLLRERFSSHHNPSQTANRAPRLNEVVLIHEEQQPRSTWKLGKVIEAPVTSENQIRSVRLQCQDGTTLVRPPSLLYALETTDPDPAPKPCTSSSPKASTFLALALIAHLFSPSSADTYELGPLLVAKTETIDVDCAPGGLRLIVPDGSGPTEICANDFCQHLNGPVPGNHYLLPAAISAFPHEVFIRSWRQGELDTIVTLPCPTSALCETIQCIFCWERYYNPQCTTWLFWIAISLTAAIPTTLIACICPCCACIATSWVLRQLWRTLTCSTYSRHQRRPSQHRLQHLRLLQNRRLLLAILLTVIRSVSGCNDVATLTGSQNICHVDNNGTMQCTFDQSTLIAFKPSNGKACLLLQDADNRPAGRIEISVYKNVATCGIKRTAFWTRDHVFAVEARKRCPGMGMCSGTTCETLKTTAYLSDLSDAAIGYPGYSFCQESCGCAACGCVSCASGCLFYRLYVKPTSENLYQAFSCPSWNIYTGVKYSLKLIGQTPQEGSITLNPGAIHTLPNLKMSVVSNSLPPLPLLGSTFLTDYDSKRTGNIGTSHSGQPVPGTVGQLHCYTAADAKKLQCHFPSSVCSCRGAETTVNCNCQTISLPQLFTDRQRLLPLTFGGHLLEAHERLALKVKISTSTVVQVQVTLMNLTTTTLIDKAICHATASDVVGCTDCLTGAAANVSCTTSHGQSQAHIECDELSISMVVDCGTTPITTRAGIHTSNRNFDTICTVSCPGGDTTMTLRGHLTLPDHEPIVADDSIAVESPLEPAPVENRLLERLQAMLPGMPWNPLRTLLICLALITFIVILPPTIRFSRFVFNSLTGRFLGSVTTKW